MIFLNYLYFLIITYISVKYLYSTEIVMRNPLDRDQEMSLSGPEAFWVLTFSTGLLALSAPGTLDLMAIRLLVLEILCLIAISRAANTVVWSAPLRFYGLFIAWIVIGCFYSAGPVYGMRVVLKYMYPLIIALTASAIVHDTEVFIKAGWGARLLATIGLFIYFIPGMNLLFPGVLWYGTAAAINFISIMIFSLGLYYFTDEKSKNLKYAVIFLIPCFVWVFRTSIMGSLVALMAFFFIMYRTRSLPIIAGIIIFGIVAVFTIPSLRQKMFKQDATNVSIESFQQGNIGMESVETNAREAMWNYLEARFYKGHELVGSGTGSVQNEMYSKFLFGGLKVPHSDFVQIKCDNGLIGLFMYAAVALLVFLHCFKVYHSTADTGIQLCAIVAGASMMGVFVTLYSDNVVNYSMATLSMPFGFYGMMLGLQNKER